MSRHTEPMTDAYITGQRLRNEARAKCKIEQLGTDWLLHPENSISREEHIANRRSTAFREHRIVIITTPSTRPGGMVEQMFSRREPLLIEHEGGAQ